MSGTAERARGRRKGAAYRPRPESFASHVVEVVLAIGDTTTLTVATILAANKVVAPGKYPLRVAVVRTVTSLVREGVLEHAGYQPQTQGRPLALYRVKEETS